MTVLVDTGPLVALLNRRDGYHSWATAQFGSLQAPLHTCEAVLAEAHHLLSRVHEGTSRLNELLDSDRIAVGFRYAEHRQRVHRLMQDYADQPMSFADACLVALAEKAIHPVVFTLDTDFTVYRRSRRRPLELIAP